ncbi:MAG: cellulase family glycosylhydrolase, partial [Planctomycetaceae bacterium]
MEAVRVSEDGKSFVLAESGGRFTPWGFNYDHDGEGRLIEDYWDKEWDRVESDFREMKELGANVVRIHLQTGKFMETAERPNPHALDQLGRLVKLAEEVGLYLDLTGLGCYHKQDVPAWYAAMDEQQRWDVQARFWAAIANTCADSPAIFCYDLMNEPVVGVGKEEWLAGAFGGKHFVQYIVRDLAGRDRSEVGRQWVEHLVSAIRRHDRTHMVTVGLMLWSPAPATIAEELDFISFHVYPESGKLDEAMKQLQRFDVGKPLLIEETFPLKCSPQELETFIEQSDETAEGWIGFYWGKTPDEYRPPKDLAEAVTLGWLELFQKRANAMTAPNQ